MVFFHMFDFFLLHCKLNGMYIVSFTFYFFVDVVSEELQGVWNLYMYNLDYKQRLFCMFLSFQYKKGVSKIYLTTKKEPNFGETQHQRGNRFSEYLPPDINE